MTRTEFLRDVTSLNSLMQFVWENDIEIYDTYDICDAESRDAYLNDNLVDWAHDRDWRDLLRILQNAEDGDGADYYLYDDWNGGYRPLDDSDVLEIKEFVLSLADEQDIWDPEPDEEEEESAVSSEESEDLEIEVDNNTILDLFTSSALCLAGGQAEYDEPVAS